MKYSFIKKEKLLISLITVVTINALLSACSETKKPLLYQLQEQDFAIIIPAKGELMAAKATVINTPTAGRFGKAISWLAPEYSLVKAGQVIAKFDGETMRIKSAERRNEIASTQQDAEKKNGQLTQQQESMNEDIGLISKEKTFADKFSIDDIRVLSKLDILDSMQNSEYLNSKGQYLNWTNDKFFNKAEGERALITMKLAQIESKLQQLTDNLVQLEIKAPHDGLLVYTANWRGEKPRVGEMMWPGMQIAKLPNINEMQLKLHVAESEAINLLTEQKVSFHLNAMTEEIFTGKIASVSPFAQTLTKGNPLKFFELIVNLDNQQKGFSPGKKVLAYIEVQAPSKKLVVPLQSVFSENNQSHVYLYNPENKKKNNEKNDDFQQVAVTLGVNSLSHIEITSGLTAGQEIALSYQEND